VRCPEREFRRRARGSRDCCQARRRRVPDEPQGETGKRQVFRRASGRNLQPAQAGECGEGEPGWRQPGEPAESAPLSRVAVETLLATYPGQGGRSGEAEKERERSWAFIRRTGAGAVVSDVDRTRRTGPGSARRRGRPADRKVGSAIRSTRFGA